MSVLELLSQFLLQPITLVLETIYGFACELMHSYGAAIIPLSLTVNFLLLPFYKRADAIQAEEREAQARMKDGLAHIKATFKGDERFMMQQAYYRQQHYKPIYSLRTVLPLVLEIPFFLAAYRFLSGVSAFDGAPFGPVIHDLGAPDQLLTVGGFTLNALPILMTLINILSTEVYTQEAPLKEKLTLHGMALIFLVLLYDSPSALVFYWTLNNLFSLMKNLVGTSAKPELARRIVYSLLGIVSLVYAFTCFGTAAAGQLVFALAGVLFQIPVIRGIAEWRLGPKEPSAAEVRGDNTLFLICCLFLVLLTGLLVPTATIVSSPTEFMLASEPTTPLVYVVPAMLLASGTFLFWVGLFYYLATPHVKGVFTTCAIAAAGIGIVDYLFFGTNMGTLLPLLQYERTPTFTSSEQTINLEVLLLVTTLLLTMWLKRRDWLRTALIAACLAVVGLSIYNAIRIQGEMPLAIKTLQQQENTDDNTFELSTDGKNVVVVMVDRAVNGYLPYLFQEKPQLREQFDGFTWYPNTLSYSNSTNTGSPAIYGGYDYRPEQMNERDDMKLVDKHNEALKTMPVVFSQAGYEVTVCDPPYAGYNWVPDLSVFDDYPQIKKFNTESGQFRETKTLDSERRRIWQRNVFCFSIMKLSPLILQDAIYQGGTYHDGQLLGKVSDYVQVRDGLSKSRGYRDNFLDSYNALSAYPSLTQAVHSKTNTFTMLYNSTAHNFSLLTEPDYTPALEIDNTEYDNDHTDRFTVEGRTVRISDESEMMSYQSNMAAMLKLGEWFDCLRDMGVYDNTRIIIVADHGALLGSFSDTVYGDELYEDAMGFNPMLMVKDFDSTGFETDRSFMTNADTPTLAFEGLIENPVSPFTGNRISSEDKDASTQNVFYTEEWQTNVNNGNTYLPGVWLTLSSHDIFDMNSWKTVGEN